MSLAVARARVHDDERHGTSAPLDNSIEIATPENITFTYRLAGPFRRLRAFAIDLAIRAAVFVALVLVVEFTTVAAGLGLEPLLLLAWFALEWLYGGVCETLANGQTPGKYFTGLRVLSVSGEPITGLQAMLRNFLRLVDMFLIAGLVACVMNRRFQRLGDLVSHTMVIVEERHWLRGVTRPDDPRAPQLAQLIPANFVVSRSLARALAHYVDRRSRFSPARRREIAAHLAAPLLGQFNLPADTSYDLLLCALYFRTFIADRTDEPPPQVVGAVNPGAFVPLAGASVYAAPKFER